MALTRHAHELIRQHFVGGPHRLAIDATCGNGHDCEFLLNLGFEKVIAFDVQQQALSQTQARLNDEQRARVQLVLDGHQNIASHTKQRVDCLMFNLGYLPHTDKSITTQKATTLTALEAAIELLSPQGLLSILCYPGHPAGAVETQAVQTWAAELNSSWLVRTELSRSPKPTAPLLLLVTHKQTK